MLIALINTIVSLYYYLLVVKAMFISQDDCVIAPFRSLRASVFSVGMCGGIVFLGIVSFVYNTLLGGYDHEFRCVPD